MAGALNSTPTQFTSLSIGSGHIPATGGDYPAGTTVYADAYSIQTIVALTLTGNKSQTTDVPVSGFTVGDYVNGTATSGLSNGITLDMWMKSANTATVQLSNVSSASAAQIAIPLLIHAVKVVP